MGSVLQSTDGLENFNMELLQLLLKIFRMYVYFTVKFIENRMRFIFASSFLLTFLKCQSQSIWSFSNHLTISVAHLFFSFNGIFFNIY